MIKRALVAILFTFVSQALCAQEQFATPEAALDALAQIVVAGDRDGFDALMGPDYAAFRDDQLADAALAHTRWERFAVAVKEFRAVSLQGEDRAVVVVGAIGWPFPIPLVRSAGQWQFDGVAGVEELRNRIVGANELNAIATLGLYTAAQREYALDDHDGDGVLEYAQRVASTPGNQDGLYWKLSEDDPDHSTGPMGRLKGLADAVLGERKASDPFVGYYFRVLNEQGRNAKAGAYKYRINGHMVAGFALVAWPANYGDTGVMSFIVNQDGVIYQRDLGKDSADAVKRIKKFDPDSDWEAVDDG